MHSAAITYGLEATMTHDTFQPDLLAAGSSRLSSKLRLGFSAHSLLWTLCLSYLAAWNASVLFFPAVRAGTVVDTSIVLLGTLPIAFFGMLILQFAFVIFIDKSSSPTRDLWRRMKTVLTDRAALARGIPAYGALTLFMGIFTMFKANVDTFVPFKWDATFDHWDKVLHFGTRPWEWLQPVFGNVPATFLLNVNYNLWFFVMIVSIIYYSFIAPQNAERTRYIMAYIVLWSLGGSLLAIVFSSAGPCYFNTLYPGNDPYGPLLNALKSYTAVVPIWAVDTQSMLWDMRASGEGLSSISAMPSMHNGTSLLFVLAMWNKGKWLRRAAVLHCALIFIGSVHLGWHYAVDAYLAWALTLVIWFAVKPIAQWWEQRPAVQSFKQALQND
jgi:PAP2 superfamily